MMDSPDPGPAERLRPSLEEQARLSAEQIRLQSVMIELLNEQLRGCRRRLNRQTERIEDLKRMIRVRDDLLLLQQEARWAARWYNRKPLRWLVRIITGSDR